MITKSTHTDSFVFAAILCGVSLFALGATSAEAQITRPQAKSEQARASSTMSGSCMSEAIGIREEALSSSFTAYSEDVTEGLQARKNALQKAWSLNESKARNTALRTAWKNWRQASSAAHTELRNDRKVAWETFKKTAKDTCKVTIPKEEGLDKAKADSITL